MHTVKKDLDAPSIHFIGIGGIGMSYLARYFKAQNWAVSGSDMAESELTQQLAHEGIQVKIGHKKGHLSPKTMLVVTSQAVKPDNPEVVEAARRGVPVTSFPSVVGGITASYDTIAIAGAHGKSTTTAMTGLLLLAAGLDPTIMVGTKLKELPHENFRAGRSSYLVVEADEYGRAFLNYSPTIAVVTNIDAEHLDIYRNLADVKQTFLKFLTRTRRGGGLILNADDKNVFSLKSKVEKIAKENHYQVVWYSKNEAEAAKLRKILKVPGSHNISNALAALSVGQLLGIKNEVIFSSLGNFTGSWRRMEYRGLLAQNAEGTKRKAIRKAKEINPGALRLTRGELVESMPYAIPIYDDYAHHPTEIKATLSALKHPFAPSPLRTPPCVVCIFQPHQGRRLELLFKDFVTAFDDADILIILPMYKVPGREAGLQKYNSETLYAALKKKYPKREIYYLKNTNNFKRQLLATLHTSSQFSLHDSRHAMIIMMGAGDIFEQTEKLLSN